ncbi:MAG TPA: adenine phosphoribosyltransferase [Acidothermaceae bacterium]
MTAGEVEELIRGLVRDVPDYPSPGILFKDITPLLADAAAFAAIVDALVEQHAPGSIDKVVGIEARGFILAAPVAYHLNAGFVPMRKKGKLPYQTFETSYALEYASATIEVHRDAFAPGDRVLIVDDVLATGGTALAALDLVHRAGGTPVGFSFLLELRALAGRAALAGAGEGHIRSLFIV